MRFGQHGACFVLCPVAGAGIANHRKAQGILRNRRGGLARHPRRWQPPALPVGVVVTGSVVAGDSRRLRAGGVVCVVDCAGTAQARANNAAAI